MRRSRVTKTRIESRYHDVCKPRFRGSKSSRTKAPRKRTGKAKNHVAKITDLVRAKDYATVDQGIELASGLESKDVLGGLLEHLDVQEIKTTTASASIYKSDLKPWGVEAKFHTLKPNTVFKTASPTRAVREYAARRLAALAGVRFEAVRALCLRAEGAPISFAGLEAFPNLERLLVCDPVEFRDTDALASTKLEELIVAGGSGTLELPACALERVVMHAGQVMLGTGCGAVPRWLFGQTPVPDYSHLDGVRMVSIDCWRSDDPVHIRRLSQIATLEELTLFGTHAHADEWVFEALAGISTLRVLELAPSLDYAPEHLSHLAEHPKLERLYFGRAKKSQVPQELRSKARKKRA